MESMLEIGWSQVVESLRSSPGKPAIAQHYADRCATLTGKQLQVDPMKKVRVLWLGISRVHALLKQAVEWQDPCITGKVNPADLGRVRGSLWRYVIAFSGWERAGRAVLCYDQSQMGFQQNDPRQLFDHQAKLKSLFSDRAGVPLTLGNWLANSMEEEDHLQEFFALSGHNQWFGNWMLGEVEIPDWKVLACLRHLVAHGALSPTTAQQWQLAPLYDEGVSVLHSLFRFLTAALSPEDLAHG